MFITDKNELQKFASPYRLWQGIPSIEVTKKGRVFMTWYSGEKAEQIGNYVVLVKSDDGVNFSEPIAVAYDGRDERCFDPCLWIDPLGRLWFFWTHGPDIGVYVTICDDPDADELTWGEIRRLAPGIMLNKPTILTTGEWIFPIAVWSSDLIEIAEGETDNEPDGNKAFAYKTVDHGETFIRLGGVSAAGRSFDEHMILELQDGTLAMYIRAIFGIAVSYSYDRGKTWTESVDSGLGGPCSRFFIQRLKSGRILLLNHYEFVGREKNESMWSEAGRNNLTALISEDDGKTWPYKLLFDERDNVSYPDAVEAADGYIYIAYDRERGGFMPSLEQTYRQARELLIAKVTEEDILAGEIKSADGCLKRVASKLGRYAPEHENPYEEAGRFSDTELVAHLTGKSNEEIQSYLFSNYGINCINMHKLDNEKLDEIFTRLDANNEGREELLLQAVELIRSVTEFPKKDAPIVERVKQLVQENLAGDCSVSSMAERLGISLHYMCHLFKRDTGVTIVDYKNELRLTKAKRLLLNTDKKVVDIATECGFGSSSYFTKLFTASEKVSPTEYREFLKNL